ncbi:MAG TPA: RNA-binding S4 domain-containing protein [Dietzia timorensis]|uniref:RNA-binding S4 domain-containing protein n=1 Tax=Dietzia timorensis TaxID=499555 RepID=A0A921F1T6_9ACTN|nr:S4 domain-containing protein [Dietzia timorensis]HJE90236.1 RNA-binding S4 domain-containing protein [Dietzia timorensis]
MSSSKTPSGRVDAWTWAVRLFPSRTKAAAACRAGHVKIDGESVPPSHKVTPGMNVRITGPGGRVRIVEIVRVISKRVGAPEAVKCYLDHSPPPPPKEILASIPTRDRGAGRPTKKERREIDRLHGRAD